jgi:hypothetical protein
MFKYCRLAMANALVMRGMLKKKILRDILMGTTAGWLVGAAWWFGVALPRRRRYEEFYRNYDDEAVSKVLKASFEEGEHYLEFYIHIRGYCHTLLFTILAD